MSLYRFDRGTQCRAAADDYGNVITVVHALLEHVQCQHDVNPLVQVHASPHLHLRRPGVKTLIGHKAQQFTLCRFLFRVALGRVNGKPGRLAGYRALACDAIYQG